MGGSERERHTHTRTNSHKHALAHSHTHTHKHTHMHIRILYIHIDTYTHTCKHTHTLHTYTRTLTHTRTHTHTRTPSPSLSLSTHTHSLSHTLKRRARRAEQAAKITGNLAYTHHRPHHITQSNGTWRACVDYLSSNTMCHTHQRIHSMPLPTLPGYLTAIPPPHLVLPRTGNLLFAPVRARARVRE